MRLDVPNLVRGQSGVGQCGRDRARGADAVRLRGDRMIGVIAGRKADDFGEDPGAARQGEFVVLEHQRAGALTQGEPGTGGIEGAQRVFRVAHLNR